MSHKAVIELPALFRYESFNRCRWKLVGGDLVAGKRERHYLNVDPWQLREEFLKVKPNTDALLEYLNGVGYWDEIFPFGATPKDFFEFQRVIRRALLESRGALSRAQAGFFGTPWVKGIPDPVAVLDWRGEIPIARIVARTPAEAILVSVVLDKMRDVRFGVCARPDCREVFKFESRHKRKYCRIYCAHLEDVRRDRRSAKAATLKAIYRKRRKNR